VNWSKGGEGDTSSSEVRDSAQGAKTRKQKEEKKKNEKKKKKNTRETPGEKGFFRSMRKPPDFFDVIFVTSLSLSRLSGLSLAFGSVGGRMSIFLASKSPFAMASAAGRRI
jgi:hypothetical protein